MRSAEAPCNRPAVAGVLPVSDIAASDGDDQLMARFCRGDENAFDTLYGRYAQPVLAFLTRMVHDEALAQDLLQVTFLSVVRARGRYQPGTSLRAWIYAIAGNAGRDALRRQASRREKLLATPPEVGVVAPADAGDLQTARQVETALMQLSPEQRQAVVLHKLHELSFEEIATALGITVSAAKVRAHRGYRRLRQLLPGGDADLGVKGTS